MPLQNWSCLAVDTRPPIHIVLASSAVHMAQARDLFRQYAEKTGSPMDFCRWQGHDFSYRGVTKADSEEEALQQLKKHTANYAHRITVYKKDGKTVKREVAEYDQREKEWLD